MINVYCPTYNRAEILRTRAIPSVLAQTHKDFQFIIVGDGCTDNTKEVVASFNDPRIKFFNMERASGRTPEGYSSWPQEEKAKYWWLMGPTWAANYALDQCYRPWIARIDDDDIWLPHHLEWLFSFAVQMELDFVSALYIRADARGYKIVGKENFDAGGTNTWLYKRNPLRYDPDCWKKYWNRNNDIDFLERLHLTGIKMGFLDEVVSVLVPRPGDQLVGSQAYLADPGKILDWIEGE